MDQGLKLGEVRWHLANPFKVSIHPLSNLAVDTWGCLEF
jgi:hypothetical protein